MILSVNKMGKISYIYDILHIFFVESGFHPFYNLIEKGRIEISVLGIRNKEV